MDERIVKLLLVLGRQELVRRYEDRDCHHESQRGETYRAVASGVNALRELTASKTSTHE